MAPLISLMEAQSNIRVGVLTFHNGPNYGGFLQAWHMRQAIRNLGYKAMLINYQGHRHFKGEQIKFTGFGLRSLKGLTHQYLKSRPFAKPIAELSGHALTTDANQIDWRRFDCVVVGSDIVWDYSSRWFGDDLAYYGALACQSDTRFVAYAPSCGQAGSHGELPPEIVAGLNRFTAIHVRDENTAAMVQQATGSLPEIVVDPTWLQDDPVHRFAKRPKVPYALVYGLGATGARAEALRAYCRRQKLILVSVSAQCECADLKLFSMDPFEWVDLFRHAHCVITSTFHGLLYAVKYRKPLVFMERNASRLKGRIAVERCGLQNRVCEEGAVFNTTFLADSLGSADGVSIPPEWRKQSIQVLEHSLIASTR